MVYGCFVWIIDGIELNYNCSWWLIWWLCVLNVVRDRINGVTFVAELAGVNWWVIVCLNDDECILKIMLGIV